MKGLLNGARGFSRIIIAWGRIFERDGYLHVYRRLSAGRFRWPRTQEKATATKNQAQEDIDDIDEIFKIFNRN